MTNRPSTLMASLLVLLLAVFSVQNSVSAATVTNHDPCSFLTSEEVEAVIGPLAGPPFRAGEIAPRRNGKYCRYESPDRRSIRITITWTGGAQFIDMMGAMQGMLNKANLSELKLSDGTVVAGQWDKAHVNQCCEFNALRGDQLVTVDIAGSHATLEQASSLASTILKRLDQPLTIDGNAGIDAAQERAARRPKPRSVCDLVSRADAEAIVGVTLVDQPTGGETSCSYRWVPSGGLNQTMKLLVQWQGGFGEWRTVNGYIGNASTMIGTDKIFGRTTTVANEGPWDEFSTSIIGVAAVKDDVMVSTESGPFHQDIARAFIKKAVLNLAN